MQRNPLAETFKKNNFRQYQKPIALPIKRLLFLGEFTEVKLKAVGQ